MAEHTLSAVPTHSRWNAALPPRLTIGLGGCGALRVPGLERCAGSSLA